MGLLCKIIKQPIYIIYIIILYSIIKSIQVKQSLASCICSTIDCSSVHGITIKLQSLNYYNNNIIIMDMLII